MNFLLDKLTDGLFIFCSVLFALYLGECSQVSKKKKELKFNLEEIVKLLPDEKPAQTISPLKILESRSPEGDCIYSIKNLGLEVNYGDSYLKLIKQRGLTQLLPDQKVIKYLTLYYQKAYPEYVKSWELLQEKFYLEHSLTARNRECYTKNEIEKIESRYGKLWIEYKMKEVVKKTIGFKAYEEIIRLGYKKRKTNTEEFQFHIKVNNEND